MLFHVIAVHEEFTRSPSSIGLPLKPDHAFSVEQYVQPISALVIPASDCLTHLYHVSNMEGRSRKENEQWSAWIVATQYRDLTPVNESDRMAARYRVRLLE